MVNFIYLHYDRNHNTNYELLGLEEDEWVKYNDQECLDKITGEFLNKIPKNFLNRPKYDAFLDLWVNVVKNVNCLLNSFQPLELTKIDFLVYYCDDNGLKDDYLQKLVFKNGTSSTSSINIFKDCKFSDVFGKTILKIKTKNKINLFIMSQSLLLQASLFSNVGYHYNILNPEENIRYVIYDLSNNQLEDFDSMKTMASEYSLVINLSSNKIKTIDSSTFDKFKALQILYLSYNQLKTLSLNLEKLPSLEELNLSNNKLTEIIFEEPSGSVLEILSLQNNKLTDAQNIWIQIQKLTKLKELYLDGNKLKRIPSEETINILKGLDFFHLYNNDFSESDVEKLTEIFSWKNTKKISFNENHYEYWDYAELKTHRSENFIMNKISSNLTEGIISSIDFREIQDSIIQGPMYNQLAGIIWKDIPMFSVITGLNGIGKSFFLKYIKDSVAEIMTSVFDTYMDINDFSNVYGIEFSTDHSSVSTNLTNRFVEILLVVDNSVIKPNPYNDKYISVDSYIDNKISIKTFSDLDQLLFDLQNELDDLGEFLEQKKFKYTSIKLEGNAFVLKYEALRPKLKDMEMKPKLSENIKISDLSPGENLIFRLLIWQFVLKVKNIKPRKSVLLFDEPDSHLHPSAVKNLLDNLMELCDLGVQIILTTHNPTTVSFIEKENLFLMEKQGDKLSIRKGGRTEIFHKLTSRLVNIEAPSRKIFVEGKDSPFYELINKFLKNVNLVNDHFNLDIMPLPGGGKCGLRNKDTIITFMKSIEPDDVSEYDTIHSYYGIIDDDNDRLDINQKERKKYAGIKNLLVLKRYSHENYILDPVNIYFYFRCLKDNNDQINENAQNLLTEVEEKVKDITKFTQTVSEELLSFKIRNIYEEIQEPTKVAVEEIKNFLQIIINAVKEKVQKLNSEIDQIKKIIKKIEKKREEEGKKYKNILEQWIKSLSKLNTDAKESGYNQLQILLKSAYEVKEEVTVLGIKLEYPKFFTCFRGHDLNDLLMQDEIFTGVINCEEEKMIKKLEETDMGIFIPDEIIEIYKTICHNITYNKEMINKLKNKKKMRLFILDMKNSDDNEKFIQ